MYSVNLVKFIPRHEYEFGTGGDDGYIHIWNRNNRQKLLTMNPRINDALTQKAMPVTAIDFDSSGCIMAHGRAYDWSLGDAIDRCQLHKLW